MKEKYLSVTTYTISTKSCSQGFKTSRVIKIKSLLVILQHIKKINTDCIDFLKIHKMDRLEWEKCHD